MNIIRNLSKLLLTIVFLYTLISNSSAQSNDYLSVRLNSMVQDLNYPHEFNLEITVSSTVDSDRLQIDLVCPENFLSCAKDTKLYQIKAKETKIFTLRAVPRSSGNINILARAQIWQNDITYASSSSLNIELDQNLEQIPQSEEYKKNKQNRDTLQTIGTIVLVILGIAGISYFAYIFRKWYNED